MPETTPPAAKISYEIKFLDYSYQDQHTTHEVIAQYGLEGWKLVNILVLSQASLQAVLQRRIVRLPERDPDDDETEIAK